MSEDIYLFTVSVNRYSWSEKHRVKLGLDGRKRPKRAISAQNIGFYLFIVGVVSYSLAAILGAWYSYFRCTRRVLSLLTSLRKFNKSLIKHYVSPPFFRAAGCVACCRLVGHGEYGDGTDGQTDGRQTVTLRFR